MTDNMNPDNVFTEVTQTSWLSRIGNSFVGVLIGLVFLLIAPCLLWWNEGNEVKAMQGLTATENMLVTASPAQIGSSLEGKPIYLTGDLQSTGAPQDPIFNIVATGSARLQRVVEMYQWHEQVNTQNQKQFGGGQQTVTTYTYNSVWSEKPIASQNFHEKVGYDNPPMAQQSSTFDAPHLQIGSYALDQTFINKLNNFQAVTPPATSLPQGFRVADQYYFKGDNDKTPHIGDVRISFKIIPLGSVSAVGMQQNNVLVPYVTNTGFHVGLISAGTVPAAMLFQQEERNQAILAWILRGLSFVLLIVGVRLILAPLTLLGAFIPFFEDLASIATGFAATIVAVPIFCATLFASWIAYRPLWAIAIALVGGGCVYGLHQLREKIKQAKKPVIVDTPKSDPFTDRVGG